MIAEAKNNLTKIEKKNKKLKSIFPKLPVLISSAKSNRIILSKAKMSLKQRRSSASQTLAGENTIKKQLYQVKY